jgi:hypothetical protein
LRDEGSQPQTRSGISLLVAPSRPDKQITFSPPGPVLASKGSANAILAPSPHRSAKQATRLCLSAGRPSPLVPPMGRRLADPHDVLLYRWHVPLARPRTSRRSQASTRHPSPRRTFRLRPSRLHAICDDVLLDVLLPGQQPFSGRRYRFRAACSNDDFLRHSGHRCRAADFSRSSRAIRRTGVSPSSNRSPFALTPTY